jgi:hypothetical protein
MLSLLLMVALAVTGWLIWSFSVDRTPSGAILVMQRQVSPPSPWEHPYQINVTRRVLV